jgi:peptidoglycan/LPS O-acetylase OafA/YrhL
MFGTYRAILALMVAASHIGGVPVLGAYAVFGFYTLSGYLMTLVMQRSYGYGGGGLAKYALNRFLRIYPIYWVSILFSAVVIWVAGKGVAKQFYFVFFLPETAVSWAQNLLLYFPLRWSPRLSPAAWSLTVEIFFYCCIGLGLSRWRGLTLAWFTASVVYHVAITMLHLGWTHRYFTLPAASLPFATGALVYHFRERLRRMFEAAGGGVWIPLALGVVMAANWVGGYWLGRLRGPFFYGNFIIAALLVAALSHQVARSASVARFDKIMGSYSYPIFLVHFPAGLLVLLLGREAGFRFDRTDATLFLFTLPVIFALSWAMRRFVEEPIELVRNRVRPQAP